MVAIVVMLHLPGCAPKVWLMSGAFELKLCLLLSPPSLFIFLPDLRSTLCWTTFGHASSSWRVVTSLLFLNKVPQRLKTIADVVKVPQHVRILVERIVMCDRSWICLDLPSNKSWVLVNETTLEKWFSSDCPYHSRRDTAFAYSWSLRSYLTINWL